jgi:hypothetical protein
MIDDYWTTRCFVLAGIGISAIFFWIFIGIFIIIDFLIMNPELPTDPSRPREILQQAYQFITDQYQRLISQKRGNKKQS